MEKERKRVGKQQDRGERRDEIEEIDERDERDERDREAIRFPLFKVLVETWLKLKVQTGETSMLNFPL